MKKEKGPKGWDKDSAKNAISSMKKKRAWREQLNGEVRSRLNNN